MKVLYIGENVEGSTSQMRAGYIKELLEPAYFRHVDTSVPVKNTPRVLRSFGWRYKRGPLIENFTKYLKQYIDHDIFYDLVWIDKAVYVEETVIKFLRERARSLIHYTPDNAFYSNRSTLFNNSIKYFDHCITTKSFEIETYHRMGAVNVLFCTQGFHQGIHKPLVPFEEKSGVIFIGLREPSRAVIIDSLIKNGIEVKLAGIGWESFVKTRSHFANLKYLGKSLMGAEYTNAISGSLLGLGLLSKLFPEQHTTRTFEIPACGTLLVTEWNQEIGQYFDDNEVLFFNDPEMLPALLFQQLNDRAGILKKCERALQRVERNGVDYLSIINNLLVKTGIKTS